MMLLEMGLEDWNIDILGTDLSSRVLKQAETGPVFAIGSQSRSAGYALLKYFRRVGLEWEFKEEVRRMVRFRPFDLRVRHAFAGSVRRGVLPQCPDLFRSPPPSGGFWTKFMAACSAGAICWWEPRKPVFQRATLSSAERRRSGGVCRILGE